MTDPIKEGEFISSLQAALEANFHQDNFGVKELAQRLFVSRSQLHRRIKVALGISASTYINEFRLKKALLLLQQGEISASEVAHQVGFSSPSYFSTSFKRHYGYSPIQVSSKDVHSPISNVEIIDRRNEFPETRWAVNIGVGIPIQRRRVLLIIGLIGAALALVLILNWGLRAKPDNPLAIKDKSIAVLPFRNFSNDPTMEAFCNGMTDDLISKLHSLADFDRVISRTSTYKFKNSKLSMPEIASELGVAYVLEGSVQKSNGKIRVNAQLIDGYADNHVWTDHSTDDWESKDIFKLQEQITSFVANAMQVAISDQESARIRKNATQNKRAYDLYLQAKFHMYNLDEESMENASQMLAEAIAIDSTFARAYSELGFIWFASGLSDGRRNQDIAWTKAKYFLNKAHNFDPYLINNEFCLLQGYFYFDWDFHRLEEFYHSRFSRYNYDRESCGLIDYAIKTGRSEMALTVIEKSIEADPLDAVLLSFKARALWFLGKEKESVGILDQLEDLNKNDWFYLREATQTYFMMKEYEHARHVLNIVLERFEETNPFSIWLKLFFAQLDEDSALVEGLYAELLDAFNKGSSGSPAWFIALYQLTIKHDTDKAFEWLEKSFADKEVELTWFAKEPLLESIRNDERYISLYSRIGFNKLKSN